MTLLSPTHARRAALAIAVAAVGLSGQASPVAAASITLRTVATGLSSPVYVTHAGDTRLFIVEQPGRIKVRQPTGAISTFLDITSRVNYGGERGLFSMAFHPDYRVSTAWGYRKFYVNYTDAYGRIVLSEFQRFATNGNRADPATERKLFVIAHPTYANHNGGLVAFGPDRMLYFSTGDGGGSGDPNENGQNVNSLLGKLLRIDPRPSATRPYTIPSTNPFVGRSGADQIWSYGLRNPWRFSFDRSTGDLWIGDVGQDRYEEVDRALSTGRGRGVNWGWDVMEGRHCFEPPTGCNTAGKQLPVVEYSHSGSRCSITGGYVYRKGSTSLTGRYLFGDYCSGEIWSWSSSSGIRLLYDTGLRVASFGQDSVGDVFVVHHGGNVYRIVPL